MDIHAQPMRMQTDGVHDALDSIERVERRVRVEHDLTRAVDRTRSSRQQLGHVGLLNLVPAEFHKFALFGDKLEQELEEGQYFDIAAIPELGALSAAPADCVGPASKSSSRMESNTRLSPKTSWRLYSDSDSLYLKMSESNSSL